MQAERAVQGVEHLESRTPISDAAADLDQSSGKYTSRILTPWHVPERLRQRDRAGLTGARSQILEDRST